MPKNKQHSFSKLNFKERLWNGYFGSLSSARIRYENAKSLQVKAKRWDYLYSKWLPAVKPETKILDIGCGHGDFIWWLSTRGYENTMGIDLSAEHVDFGKSLGIKGLGQASFLEFATANNAFDLIVLRDVLEHIPKKELFVFLEKVFRTLKPEGCVFIQVPNGHSPFYGTVFHSDLTHEVVFSDSSLNQVLRSVGLDVLSLEGADPIPVGFGSTIRYLLWKIVRCFYRSLLFVETGRYRWFVTVNILAVATKSSVRKISK